MCFIDDGDGNEWAEALRFPPFIDCDHDGVTFPNISFLTPDMALQRSLDAGEGGRNSRPAVCVSLHANPSEPKGQQDHDRHTG